MTTHPSQGNAEQAADAAPAERAEPVTTHQESAPAPNECDTWDSDETWNDDEGASGASDGADPPGVTWADLQATGLTLGELASMTIEELQERRRA